MGTQRLLTGLIIVAILCNRAAPAIGHLAFGLMVILAGWMWWKERKQIKQGLTASSSVSRLAKMYGGLFLVFLCTTLPSVFVGDLYTGLRTVVYILSYRFIMFLVTVKFIRKREYLYSLIAAFFITVAADSLLSYYQYYLSGFKYRGLGFAGPMLALGGILCIAVPIALVTLFDLSFPRWLRYLSGLSLAPFVMGFLGNQSRSTWIFSAFSVSVVGLRYCFKSWKIVLPVMVLAFGFAYYIYQDPILMRRLGSAINTTTDGSNLGRIYVWKSSINMIKDHFFFGVGLEQFADVYRSAYILPEEWQRLGNAHNNFLQIFAETGIVGFIGFLIWIFGSIGYGIREFLKRNYSPYLFSIVLLFLVYHVIFGLVEYTLVINARMIAFWVLLAVMLQLEDTKEK